MSDIVERLRARKEPTIEVDIHYPQIVDSDTPDAECLEAADEITRLRVQNIQMQAALGYAICAEDERHIIPSNPYNCGVCEANKGIHAEIDRLRAEVKVWQSHAKTAIWSDSEECKMLTAEVERLLKSRNRWAKKYNDLLAKRRAEDGYDVYAAAREEYRKKITEQADEIDRLRAALREIESNWEVPMEEKGWRALARFMWETARAALGEKA